MTILRSHVGGAAEVEFVSKGDMTHDYKIPPHDHVILWQNNVDGGFRRSIQRQVSNDRLLVFDGQFNDILPLVPTIPCVKRKPR